MHRAEKRGGDVTDGNEDDNLDQGFNQARPACYSAILAAKTQILGVTLASTLSATPASSPCENANLLRRHHTHPGSKHIPPPPLLWVTTSLAWVAGAALLRPLLPHLIPLYLFPS